MAGPEALRGGTYAMSNTMADAARATLADVCRMWGAPSPPAEPPETLTVRGMEVRRWRRVGPKRGKETVYELEAALTDTPSFPSRTPGAG